MRCSLKNLCFLFLLSATGGSAFALELGDPAPPLSISEWIQGNPVEIKADSDNVYVIEFWATWCPPCRRSIPDLNALYDKHKAEGLVIVGVTDEEPGTVKEFMKNQEMKYTVARDKESGTWKAYAESSGVTGIPHAFVVKKGQVMWQGSPFSGLEGVVEALLANQYTIESAREAAQTARLDEEKGQLLDLWAQEYIVYATYGRDKESADGLGKRILEQGSDNAELLGGLAWNIASNNALAYRNLEFARELSTKACTLTESKNPDILDTHARVLFELGQKDEAIAQLKKALELCEPGDMRDMIEQNLKQMENPDGAEQPSTTSVVL